MSLEDDTRHDTGKVVGEKIPGGNVRTHPVTQHRVNAPYSNAYQDEKGPEALQPVRFFSFF